MPELSKDNLLRSWKEISAHLGCDVRTCHRWEVDRGMPVHRAQGAETKSPVFAYKNELNSWFKETFTAQNGAPEKKAPTRGWLRWAGPAAAVLVLTGIFLYFQGAREVSQPADFTIEGTELVILDKHKQELWRVDTGLEGLMPESYFRPRFQKVNLEEENAIPTIAIKDIDGDGKSEVLFAPKTLSARAGVGWMQCFDSKGREIWHFDAGRELRCGGEVFSPDYRVNGFVCHDMDGDGRLETLVIAFHRPDWPCQMAVLDAEGRMIAEYWHAGYLRTPLFQDLDGDGREELIVVGVNNQYEGGSLAVFDTRRIGGSSPQSGKWACEGLEPGTELYYVTVPYTDVSKAQGYVIDGFHQVFVTGNNRIKAVYGTSLFYEFDFGLRCMQVTFGHGYINAHDEGVRAGKITSVLDDAYKAMLMAGIRYWDGSAMVSEPTMVKH
jgi:hypothetical protein